MTQISQNTLAAASPNTGILAGVACGAAAGAVWGLVFLAPALVSDFNPMLLAAGRYLFYGLISAALLLPRWRRIKATVGRREWLALVWLSLAGNTLYYLLLSTAVQVGGIAMTTLIIGFLPVFVTIIGSRDKNALPLARLVPSLVLCAAGVLCIGWDALVAPSTRPYADRLLGLICAVGALISWTAYAVGNSRWLARLHHISVHDWNLLTGVVTGAQSLVLVPIALMLETTLHSHAEWGRLVALSMVVAILASLVGNAFWNRMSRLLPLTLAGQMILFETMFALLYGFLWEGRWPKPMESAAFALVVFSVLSCIAAHRRPNTPRAVPAENPA